MKNLKALSLVLLLAMPLSKGIAQDSSSAEVIPPITENTPSEVLENSIDPSEVDQISDSDVQILDDSQIIAEQGDDADEIQNQGDDSDDIIADIAPAPLEQAEDNILDRAISLSEEESDDSQNESSDSEIQLPEPEASPEAASTPEVSDAEDDSETGEQEEDEVAETEKEEKVTLESLFAKFSGFEQRMSERIGCLEEKAAAPLPQPVQDNSANLMAMLIPYMTNLYQSQVQTLGTFTAMLGAFGQMGNNQGYGMMMPTVMGMNQQSFGMTPMGNMFAPAVPNTLGQMGVPAGFPLGNGSLINIPRGTMLTPQATMTPQNFSQPQFQQFLAPQASLEQQAERAKRQAEVVRGQADALDKQANELAARLEKKDEKKQEEKEEKENAETESEEEETEQA